MNRLILDTNILVSSLIQKNYPYLIVEHCLEGDAGLCLSSILLKEYIEVLRRPKFARFPDFSSNASFLITRLSELAEIYEPKTKLDIIKDYPDNRLLELAQESKADFIITGNTKDFYMDNFDNTQILTPKQYWEEYK
ncbi:MAG: putative toxin-antitoxin system toxin component, PIN family [Candidatus Kapaibacteriales bacterium]